MKKSHKWIYIFLGSLLAVCIVFGIYSSTSIIVKMRKGVSKEVSQRTDSSTKSTAESDKSTEENEQVDIENKAEGNEETEVTSDVSVDESEPEHHELTQADWLKISKAGAALINAKEVANELTGQPVMAAGMGDSELEFLLSSYFYCLNDEENPGISFQDSSISGSGMYQVFSENTIRQVIRSITGEELEHVIQGNYIKYEDNNYLLSRGDGAPVYHLRLCKSEVQGERVVITAEMMEDANIGSYTDGIYELVLEEDHDSLYFYHFVSVEKQSPVEGKFIRAEASSVLQSSSYGDYKAENVLDRNPSTAWVEGVDGLGVGESITISADEPQKIHGISILEGYAKNQDIFSKNAYPYKFRLEFSDGSVIEAEPEEYAAQSWSSETPIASRQYKDYTGRGGSSLDELEYNMDFISFGKVIETTYIKITILEVQPGTTYEDTCISEVIPY